MMRPAPILRRLARDTRGAMLVETAIVAPVLILLSLGAFQVSTLVARQSELQSAAAEAEAIALASAPDTAEKITTLQQVVMASTGLTAQQVAISNTYRCNAASSFVASKTGCATDARVSTYLRLQIQDTYTPTWTQFGVGSPIQFNVVRFVLVSQGSNT